MRFLDALILATMGSAIVGIGIGYYMTKKNLKGAVLIIGIGLLIVSISLLAIFS